MSLVVRPGILDIDAYVPGEHSLPGGGPVYKMSSNESAIGPSKKAVEAYAADAAELHRYADGGAVKLREVIAASFGTKANQIVCGAGSDEILQLLTRAYAGPGDEVLYSRHGFLVYPISAQAVGATPVAAPERDLTTDVDALLAKVTPRTRICFVANPNNPTGSYISSAEMRRLRKGLPDNVLLVIDAAYAEYVGTADYSAGHELVQEFDNVAVAHTFSKIYGLAALRLGWVHCSAATADVLNRIRGPFNTSGPAQAAGIAARLDEAHVAAAKAYNDYWLPWLSDRVREIGLKAYPSVCNFLLVGFPSDPKLNAMAADAFLKSRRVLVRKMGAYGLPDCLRISIAEEPALRTCADALSDFVKQAATQ